MSVLDQLAYSLGRRDEVPNTILAKVIADKNNHKAVKELVANLYKKNKNIQSDCIKVLYETGEINPSLIAPYCKDFFALLESSNNRLVWGSMSAIDAITLENPEAIYKSLGKIEAAAAKGSVITRDHAVNILIKLSTVKRYAEHAFNALITQLQVCPVNQLPMYTEKAFPVINSKNKAMFIQALTSRLNEIEQESKRKRVLKVIEKLV